MFPKVPLVEDGLYCLVISVFFLKGFTLTTGLFRCVKKCKALSLYCDKVFNMEMVEIRFTFLEGVPQCHIKALI